jgi:hypothetical protein
MGPEIANVSGVGTLIPQNVNFRNQGECLCVPYRAEGVLTCLFTLHFTGISILRVGGKVQFYVLQRGKVFCDSIQS